VEVGSVSVSRASAPLSAKGSEPFQESPDNVDTGTQVFGLKALRLPLAYVLRANNQFVENISKKQSP
jgi:hypothetical protein